MNPVVPEIPFIRPSYPKPAELVEELEDIAEANWYSNFGPKERQFAHALGDYIGCDVGVATFANGTLALIAALNGTIDPSLRDRYVLMPSFTFVAAAQAALWAGYRPWFIDIDADNWQPSLCSAHDVLAGFRDQIAGILLPNVFGVGNPEIDAWEQLAAEWDLPLVLDSAAGFGSVYADGSRVGQRGICEVFSFHATKPFGIGEGGALAARNPHLIEWVQSFQNFGFTEQRQCTQLGLNAKLPEISAAIGLCQLRGFDRRLAGRRGVFQRYRTELGEGIGLRFQPNADASSLCFASTCCAFAEQKAAVLTSLRRHAVRAHDYYNPPQHLQPYFLANPELVNAADLTVTEHVCARIVSLPIHDHMAHDDVARVIAAVREGCSQVEGGPQAMETHLNDVSVMSVRVV